MAHRSLSAAAVALLLALTTAPLGAQNVQFDFALHKDFLAGLRNAKTINQAFDLSMLARSDIHGLSDDCEAHIAATFANETPAVTLQTKVDPPGVVVEPPNLCKFAPGATTMSGTAPKAQWRKLLDSQVIANNCKVSGFPRLFTEHSSGTVHPSNPNHVFEIHPATGFQCGSNTIAFDKFITAPAGLRHIQPASAARCIAERKLEARRSGDRILFRESAGHGCGNFAIVEITHAHAEWRASTGGGHSIIARVTADGDEIHTLKLYTFEGTRADDWVVSLTDDDPDTQRRVVHGLFTYDYFTLFRTTMDDNGEITVADDDWTEIEFPLAFIVFGFTSTVPWEEQ